MLIKHRIVEYVESQGMSMYSFYRDSGITRNTFSNPSGISEQNLMKFRRYAPDVSLHWLVEGEGGMFQRWTPANEPLPTAVPDAENLRYEPSIRLRQASDVAAGYQTQADDTAEEEGISLYELRNGETLSSLLSGTEGEAAPTGRLVIPGAPSCDGALRIPENDAFRLRKGDIVFFRKCTPDEEPAYGETYLLSLEINGEETLSARELLPGSTPELIRLAGDDPKSVPQEIYRSRIRAMAMIVGHIRFNVPHK